MIIPTAAWTGSGTRPVIDYAAGTQGLAQSCAPSAQLAAGTEYETANIVRCSSRAGPSTLTDYQGYTTGSQTLFGVGGAEGHAVLDAAKAADQIPGSGLSPSAPRRRSGATRWVGRLRPGPVSCSRPMTPSMNLVGVAAGGIPGNLLATAELPQRQRRRRLRRDGDPRPQRPVSVGHRSLGAGERHRRGGHRDDQEPMRLSDPARL